MLGEVEKKSFSALPVRPGYSGLMPSKPCVPTQEDWGRSFTAVVQGELLTGIKVLEGPALL